MRGVSNKHCLLTFFIFCCFLFVFVMNRDYITFSFAIQELFREYATSSQHLKTEHDMHRKQAELEDRIQQRLKEAERERGNGSQKGNS